MARRRNPVLQWFVGVTTLGAAYLLAVLPLSLSRSVARGAARIAEVLIPRVRNATRANIDAAYGDQITPAEKRRIARGAVDNVAIVAAEFSRIPRLHGAFRDSQVTVEGIENVDRTKGGFMISAHIGNWEWLAAVNASLGFKTAEVVRPLDFPALNRYIDRVRRSHGVVTIPREGAGPEVIRLLREGYIVGVLVDQQPRESAAPVTFFDKPCWSTIAPVMAALRARVPVYPVSLTRNRDGRYTMRYYPPLEMVRTKDFRADLVLNCQNCQDVIETMVRRQPEQWLWLHRRWKQRDRLEREWAKRGIKDGAGTVPENAENRP